METGRAVAARLMPRSRLMGRKKTEMPKKKVPEAMALTVPAMATIHQP
jgi:hypothetical protein